eukprot:1159610-Pelagomonas_calceolata.AAC.7
MEFPFFDEGGNKLGLECSEAVGIFMTSPAVEGLPHRNPGVQNSQAPRTRRFLAMPGADDQGGRLDEVGKGDQGRAISFLHLCESSWKLSIDFW